jgi:hypothetical protein
MIERAADLRLSQVLDASDMARRHLHRDGPARGSIDRLEYGAPMALAENREKLKAIVEKSPGARSIVKDVTRVC